MNILRASACMKGAGPGVSTKSLAAEQPSSYGTAQAVTLGIALILQINTLIAMATLKSDYADINIPEDVSVLDFIYEKFDQYGDSVAVADAATGRSYTFTQVKDYSRRIASALTRQGMKKGDVIGIISPNVPEYVLMHCGIAEMGGVMSGVNPLYTEDEIYYQLEMVEAKLIVTVPPFAEKCLNTMKKLPGIQDVYVFGEAEGCKSFKSLLGDDGSACPNVKVSPEDTYALLFSSGTTGLPKGVILTNKTVLSNLCQIEAYPELLDTNHEDTVLDLLPYFHSYGLVVIMLHGLRAGARQVAISRFDPEVFLKTIQDYKVSLLYLVPPIILFLAKHPMVDKYDLSAVRQITSGAAPLGGEMVASVETRLGIKIIRQGFGMTETGPVLTITPTCTDNPASVGKLLPNTVAKVVDTKSGALLGEGQDGELCFQGPQVMPGYFKNPEATAKTLDADGFIHTGDVGHFDKDGLFYIVDRLKELIKYKGYQVAPAELEALLLTHPSIMDAAVIGIPHEEAGELPKAFVVKKKEELTADEVAEFVAGNAAPYKKLRGGVEFVKSIPKSASGKILRRVLREKKTENQQS
ncbi:4-coumarate--CoA ligase-like [Lytechinus variegatus]|uniref:4-coumarate--CoA ligase-like n=1 Tax=Lytechinus variegatus TaxID=7654 RepID=UPI001BB285CA|nr:4-coumarate--CoA ligase-like [Lytechinus variegatus]